MVVSAPPPANHATLCTPHTGLQRAQPKLQLASLSVVCCALAAPSPPLRDVLLADGAVADALWPLLSHDSPGVRGKAAAAVALMGRENATWLVEMCSSKVRMLMIPTSFVCSGSMCVPWLFGCV